MNRLHFSRVGTTNLCNVGMYDLHVAMHAAAPLYLQIAYRGSIIQVASSIAQQHGQPPVAPQLNRGLHTQGVLMGHQRKEKKRKEKKRKEKKRKDYAFWRQFNEKPSIIPSCPGWVINIALYTCRGGVGGASTPADAATHARHPATAAPEVAAAVLAR